MNLGPIFTPANQLTLMRMLLIPAFVILLIYGYRGWAVVTFIAAGLTDLLDGLIAREYAKGRRRRDLDCLEDEIALQQAVVASYAKQLGQGFGHPVHVRGVKNGESAVARESLFAAQLGCGRAHVARMHERE